MTDHRTDYVNDEPATMARAVFSGLRPSPRPVFEDAPTSRASNPTVPILLAGTMTLTGAIAIIDAAPKPEHKPDGSSARGAVRLASVSTAAVVTATAPATYRVVAGDTVSGIAGRYGLSTAKVLSLNGLSSKSLIFPGQVLKLTGAAAIVPVASVTVAPAAAGGTYTIAKGDTIGKIAARFGVSTQAVLSANKLGWSSIIYPGQVISIPGKSGGQTIDAVTVSSVTPAPAAPASTVAYVIKAGDTISKIAAKFGVGVQAMLDANGLTRSSIIYTGRTLTIPSTLAAVPTSSTTPSGITLLNHEQTANAQTIISVGRSLGVPDYGIVIALATAMQESSLRNLNYGHLDSVGLFQQRPSAGWGSIAQLTDATHATKLFYGGPSNPNKGKTRGLLDVSGWQSMTLTKAAQRVQVSAYPDAYAKWEASARVWFAALG